MKVRFAFLLLSAMLGIEANGQGPDRDWQTIATPHFRIHYPRPYEAWARRAAARIESIREEVALTVDYVPPEIVDVIVMDPASVANGSAWPLLGSPRLILWTHPPAPEGQIGHQTDWMELLLVHEEAHLAHLLRPSRNRWRRLVSEILPIGPIVQRAPRWVMEGYATVVEGELTGSGRPHSSIRAAILRSWALTGRLPSYRQLSSDSRSWLGMSMAYLVGSAYLEWLLDREGPDSLRKVWARLSARADRTFDGAFEGVYGDRPDRLYGRFVAEVTAAALELERELIPVRDGVLWQDLTWTTEPLDVSPDGTSIVTVLRARQQPSKLVVLSNIEFAEDEKKTTDRMERLLKLDPEDFAPVARKPGARKRLHELSLRDGRDASSPRWLPGGDAVLFASLEPDEDRFLHSDLFRWNLAHGSLERLTKHADLRDADPSPDGRSAVAVRNRFGFSEIVRVNLPMGSESSLFAAREVPRPSRPPALARDDRRAVPMRSADDRLGLHSITQPSVEIIYDSPRFDPSGKRIAYVRHSGGRWRLIVHELASAREVELPVPHDAVVAQPAWSADGTQVFAAVGRRGFIEIGRFNADGSLTVGEATQITRSVTASLAPSPSRDGKLLYFLALDPDGYDLRRIELKELEPLSELRLDSPPFAVTSPAETTRPPRFREQEIPTGRSYGVGRQEIMPLFGFNRSRSTSNLEALVRIGDVVGRLETLVAGSFGVNGGPEGGRIASTWRGWPVSITLNAFQWRESPDWDVRTPLLAFDKRGVSAQGRWSRNWRATILDVSSELTLARVETDSAELEQRIVSVASELIRTPRIGTISFPASLTAHADFGETADDRWQRGELRARGGLIWEGNSLIASVRRGISDSLDVPIERFHAGGAIPTIATDAESAFRIASPAVPAGIQSGDEFELDRVTLRVAILPVRFFYERFRFSNAGEREPWFDLAGAELVYELDRQPVLQLPSVELTAGVARLLSAPLHGDVEWWVGLRWKP